jgi:hypothetical protein
MPVLKNSKHEAFARAVVTGSSLTKAYKGVYPDVSDRNPRRCCPTGSKW